MARRMTAQKKAHMFNSFDPISIIGFVKSFKLACGTSCMHEGATTSLLHDLMKKTAFFVLIARLCNTAQLENVAGRLVIRLGTLPPTNK